MNLIYKYPLELMKRQQIELPLGAKVVSFQAQAEQLCVWALIDTEQEDIVQETFCIIGTGLRIPSDATKYVGTAQIPPYVWHLFIVPS